MGAKSKTGTRGLKGAWSDSSQMEISRFYKPIERNEGEAPWAVQQPYKTQKDKNKIVCNAKTIELIVCDQANKLRN